MKFSSTLLIIGWLINLSLSQQPIFEENFDYPAGTNLTAYGWTNHSGSGFPLQIVTPGLVYANYPPSGIGNSVEIVSGSGSREDANNSYNPQSSGSLYAGFMVNVSSATTVGEYFLHLSEDPLSTSFFRGKVFVKSDAGNNIAFGIAKGNNADTVYTDLLYSLNTTYLVVFEYVFNPGATDDSIKLHINPSLPGSKPIPNIVQADASTDPSALGTVALRQSGTNGPTLFIDGIRIGTSWESVTVGTVVNPPVISSLSYEPFPANQSFVMSCDVSIATGVIDSVKLYYYTDFSLNTLDSLQMSPTIGDEFEIMISPQQNGVSFIYWVKAWGNSISSLSGQRMVVIGLPDMGMFHTQTDTNGLPLHLDHLTKLKGIVTVSTNVFSTENYDFYMQDNTGGINVFSFDYTPDSTQYLEGDSLEVVGTIDAFNGKVEIVDFNAVIINRGNPMPQPIDVNIEDMGEEYEGRLISINNVSPTAGSNPWPTTLTSVSLDITDGTGDLILRIVDSTYIGINPEPLWPVTVVGIGNQFDFSPPFDEFYQIQPRSYGDFLTTGITDRDPLVLSFTLLQNYPNPFNPTTIIRWQLPVSSPVILTVYNLTGQKVVTLVDDIQAAGSHSIVWNAADMASGMYFYHLEAKGYSEIRKMILMK